MRADNPMPERAMSAKSDQSDLANTAKVDGECMLTARGRLESRFRNEFAEARRSETAQRCGNYVQAPPADWRKQ
jgi:hypothetical protein